MEGQDEFIMRKSDNADVGLGEVYEEEVLADAQRAVGCNTDLYVVNQEAQNTDLLREAHTGDARRPVRLSFTFIFMVGQDPF